MNNNIKTLREQQNMSASELAKKIKVSRQYIYQIERSDKPKTYIMLQAIAKILNVSIEGLYNELENKK